MERSMDLLIIAVSMLIMCGLVALIFYGFSSSKGLFTKTNAKFLNTLTATEQTIIAENTGDDVLGERVQYVIKKLVDIPVTIQNSKSSKQFTRDDIVAHSLEATAGIEGFRYTAMTDVNSLYYVNPNGVFSGVLRKSENGEIIDILYIQLDTEIGDALEEQYTEVKDTSKQFTRLRNGVYNGTDVKTFITTDLEKEALRDGYHFAVTLVVGGESYFFTETTGDKSFSSSLAAGDQFYVTVEQGSNKNVMITITEMSQSNDLEAIRRQLLQYKTGNTGIPVLVVGKSLEDLLLNCANNSLHKIYVKSTKAENTYNATNPYSSSSGDTGSAIDKTGIYGLLVTGDEDTLAASSIDLELYSGLSLSVGYLTKLYDTYAAINESSTAVSLEFYVSEDGVNYSLADVAALDNSKAYQLSSIEYVNNTGCITKFYFNVIE